MSNSNLTFVFVQLAAYPKHDYSEIRNAQMAALKLPNVGYAVAVDLGDPASPWHGLTLVCFSAQPLVFFVG